MCCLANADIIVCCCASLYGSEKAKTNFPAQEYLSYFAMPANPMLPAEPLANASQLVEELQQVVSRTTCPKMAMGPIS